jgi:RNA polymerase sigma factor (sigma-70 family)
LPQDVEDLSEQISLLLLADDYRRLKTYDPAKAKLRTWLRKIVQREVSHVLQKHLAAEPIEEVAKTQISVAATQEEELLTKEERALLDEAITQLTPHDQRIAWLKLNGATDEEVAQIMNIKPGLSNRNGRKLGSS